MHEYANQIIILSAFCCARPDNKGLMGACAAILSEND